MASTSNLPPRRRARIPLAVALLMGTACVVHAQTTLKPVVVTGNGAPPMADILPFGDVPLRDVPASATVITRRQFENAGARRLADLTQFDASVSDAYNAPGYWDFLSIRGFTLDNKYNYRREGLPINAETAIPLYNKDQVEILRGTSGLQAGVSAPGGLVNYVVKRPTEGDLREVRLEATSRSSLLGAVDLGGRLGTDRRFGYRINAAHERLRPETRFLDGERSLLAAALDWRLTNSSVLEAEFEWSSKHQSSQAGFSLLGGILPAVADPRINLNNQPWLQPTEFNALTGTLRWTHSLSADWRLVAQWGTQRLRTDDYTAFPFGCSAEGNFDRYCSDGTFDYYDFRSENERRRQDAASLQLKGKFAWGATRHDLSATLLASKAQGRFPPQAFNYAGTGDVSGTAVVPESPHPAAPVAPRDQRTLELSLADAIRWNERFTTWLGLRHTRLERGYEQSLTTPWLAATYKLDPSITAYASYGKGIESQQVPNSAAIYANPGEVLPALESRQWEVGVKGETGNVSWQAAWFDIVRPMSNIAFCDRTFAACVGQFDGRAEHRGLEAGASWASNGWRIGSSITALQARREGSVLEPVNNGRRPPNVPAFVLRAHTAWKPSAVPGLELRAHLSHEGRRAVFADESVMLPAWTRIDLGAHYEQRLSSGVQLAWNLGIDNVMDRRYWKESPYQFGHVYLYPGAPRTFRLGLTATL